MYFILLLDINPNIKPSINTDNISKNTTPIASVGPINNGNI